MKLKADDYELFKRLKLGNVIDLALLLPKKIENLNESESLAEGAYFTGEVLIKSSSFRGGNTLFGSAYSPKFDEFINFVFFNASRWQSGALKVGLAVKLHGKMGVFNNSWQLSNPKIISKMGGFFPKFQITGVKDESIKKLIQSYVNYENLSPTGLSQRHINFLLNLHANDEKSYQIFSNLQPFLADLKYIEMYNFLRRLKSKEKPRKAFKIELFDINEWLLSLPFKPTNDQLQAIKDIENDLQSEVAKRRVVMGDVGCGKTLVLLAASLMTYPKQAILMAPTSILATQIYEEAIKLLPSFMQILFIKGGKKEKNLEEKIKKANLIIGTHALIHLKHHNAVLVMIDEQHRFGSGQRQKVHSLNSGEFSPHFVQFSATPIPRTLSMIQSELLNFSFIKQMPFAKDISTICIQNEGFNDLITKIRSEIAKNNQAIIIYPLVTQSDKIPYLSLDEALAYWQKNFKNVFVTHGKDKDKDKILSEFKEKGDILLSTTVVEVGISLPRLSTIVIVGAERLGLATLHQLRGRVGRVGLKSYCYLYTKLRQIPSRLLEFADTLDGFKIAEIDLKNRLSGDLIDGFLQHGNEFKFFDFSEDEAILEQVKRDISLI